MAFNGAEPVRAATLEAFTEAFAPLGFRRQALLPCYGLAEATLFVAGAGSEEPPRAVHLDGSSLEENRAVGVPEDAPGARQLVSCGTAPPGARVEIVDAETCLPVPAGAVGEIWVAGDSLARGYWNRPQETAETFGARLAGGEGPEAFLRTGDLGFSAGGELFVTGRLKDLVILRGRNHYPQDIELTAESSHPALRPGCAAAFAVEVQGEERLALVQEVRRDFRSEDFAPLLEAIRKAVAEVHEVEIWGLGVGAPGGRSQDLQRQGAAAGLPNGLRWPEPANPGAQYR